MRGANCHRLTRGRSSRVPHWARLARHRGVGAVLASSTLRAADGPRAVGVAQHVASWTALARHRRICAVLPNSTHCAVARASRHELGGRLPAPRRIDRTVGCIIRPCPVVIRRAVAGGGTRLAACAAIELRKVSSWARLARNRGVGAELAGQTLRAVGRPRVVGVVQYMTRGAYQAASRTVIALIKSNRASQACIRRGGGRRLVKTRSTSRAEAIIG